MPVPPFRQYPKQSCSGHAFVCSWFLGLSYLAIVPLNGTALALKLYRCEKGTCPESLDALVPAFLPKLFCDPYTGAPLTYQRLPGNAFELSFPSAPHNRVRSKPNY